jgi:hypothetical protein
MKQKGMPSFTRTGNLDSHHRATTRQATQHPFKDHGFFLFLRLLWSDAALSNRKREIDCAPYQSRILLASTEFSQEKDIAQLFSVFVPGRWVRHATVHARPRTWRKMHSWWMT